MQSVGRRLAAEPPPDGVGLQDLEHVGSQPVPLRAPFGARSWYSVYLDNWDQFTIAEAAACE
eukprot:9885797-Lingulodinium_polyedra.AAC.1